MIFCFQGIKKMKNNHAVLCVAVALPFAASAVFAQNQATAQPIVEDAYTLKVPTAPASQVSGTAYELKGTTISGATTAPSQPILTSPVGDAAAYKTDSGVYLYPTVFVGMGYNDNLQTTSNNQISSSLINVAPQLIAEMKHKGDRYTALVSVNNVNYASSTADNSTNSELKIAGDNYFTARARAAWSLGQVRSTDPRGANNRPISAEPDRWTANNVDGRFVYGAPEAQGRLELDLGNTNKTYDNNRANTAVADVSVGSVASRAYYRLGTRSLALGEIRNAKINYVSSLSTDSNTERRYYVGLTWDATAATTGIIKLGRMTKDFDLAGRQGYEGVSWEASVRWMPLTYSTIDLQTSRSTAEPSGFGNYAINTGSDLTWNHRWTRSLTTRAALGLVKTDFAGTTRSDSATSYALTMDYAVLRWLKIGVDWAAIDSTSNEPAAAFKRNVTMFTLNASL
jgi:hypothetical protein